MSWWDGVDETRVLIAPDHSTSEKHDDARFLSLRHPKSGNATSYLLSDDVLNEIHWFKQCYGSWFLGDYVSEDGRLYTATPVDPVFTLLPIFEEARMKKGDDQGKFRQLDEIIYIHGYPGYQSLASIAEKCMQIVCDVTEVGSTKFFRLNDLKVQKWLYYKVHQLKQMLPTLDKNYAARNEKDALMDAASIVGEYLKDETWLKILCDKLKLNFAQVTNAPDKIIQSSVEAIAPFIPVQEKRVIDKQSMRTTRQTKKPKLETESKNIKDMFSRATRKGR